MKTLSFVILTLVFPLLISCASAPVQKEMIDDEGGVYSWTKYPGRVADPDEYQPPLTGDEEEIKVDMDGEYIPSRTVYEPAGQGKITVSTDSFYD